MGFISILFWLFVGWLLWGLVKVLMTGHRMASQYKRAMNDMRAAFGGAAGRQQPTTDNQQPKQKEKKISKDVGEYVDFEEVSVSATQKNADGSTTTYTETEQQVTDVTWEDV